MSRYLLLIVLSLVVLNLADNCPASHCSFHGKCLREGTFEMCLCYDDDQRGHFTGDKCQYCLDGFKWPRCVELDLLPDTTWLLMMAFTFVFISCAGVFVMRLVCYLGSIVAHVVRGNVDDLDHLESTDDEGEGFPVIDPGNDSEEEQRKAEATAHRQMMAQIVGESQDPEDEKEDENICKICFENTSNAVLLDCGHMCTCFECGSQLRQCPFCRKPIDRVKKIYRI